MSLQTTQLKKTRLALNHVFFLEKLLNEKKVKKWETFYSYIYWLKRSKAEKNEFSESDSQNLQILKQTKALNTFYKLSNT